MSAVLNCCVVILNRFQPQFALSLLKFFCELKTAFIPVTVGAIHPLGLHCLGVPLCALVDLGLESVNLGAGVSGARHAGRFQSHCCTSNYVVPSFVLDLDSTKTIDLR